MIIQKNKGERRIAIWRYIKQKKLVELGDQINAIRK